MPTAQDCRVWAARTQFASSRSDQATPIRRPAFRWHLLPNALGQLGALVDHDTQQFSRAVRRHEFKRLFVGDNE